MPARKSPTATMLATEAATAATAALEKIALQAELLSKHEKECGERWAQAHAELKALSKSVSNHGARWEKTAWLIVTITIGAAITTVARGWF
jgi:hypothetical protein